MALILKDRVKETSSSSGTGSITLGGAFPGYQTFNAAIASGSTVYYTIHNLTAGVDNEWEVGLGTFTSPATLARTTVISSSTGSLINFTAGASGLEVFITQPAEEAVYINQATGLVEAFGNGANTISFTNVNTTNLTANTVTLTAGTITTNAANATDITNKAYVDGLVESGVHFHEPVLVEEDSPLVAVYDQPNGSSNGIGATLTNNDANVALVVDGVTVSNTARILVLAQANAVQNGVYTVTNPGAPDTPGPGAKWVLTRSTDTDTYGVDSSESLSAGSTFFVSSGNTGAGRTYTCNVDGVITFGTTNITFAQISSSQIYAAGTGLNLANLTFSISNTAVTAAQYGNDGAVGQFTVNAQGQLTNAANVSINASSISVGTLANARTTANSANGASTIVARDSNGSFTANIITATDVNATNVSATTGTFTNISGNGATVTNINASNITSGTINNAFTTGNSANSASTLVLRDANGSFGANIISASFSGDGSAITGINASSISSGTIANARTTAVSANGASTIVSRDSGGSFDANLVNAVSLSGNAATVTGINASNIASGTIANARTTAATANGASTIVLRGASGEFAAGAITGTSFSGNGSAITAINATAITTGTLDNARTNATSANGASTIVVRDANGSFAGNVITGTTGTFTNISGNGTSLTAINASNISSGTIANARTTASDANGASTIVSRDANGSFTANIITANGSAISAINGSNVTTGTVANARTTASDANGASTIVSRSAAGSFAGNVITATTFSGSGASLTSIPNSATTAASANGASTIVARDANGSFTANVGTFTTVSGAGGGLTAINASNVSSGTLSATRGGTGSANLTAENVILGNGANTVKVVAPGTANNVLTSNGTTWISQAPAGGGGGTVIPAGTVMIFGQTAAPTGFTKLTNFDNYALRVVSGTASSGGSVAFTTAFASGLSAGATTLSTPQIPSHTHTITTSGQTSAAGCAPGYAFFQPASTGATGGGGSHNHTIPSLAVLYVDVIRASKD